MTNLRVLIADDEPLARRGVRQLLADHTDIIVAGEARNGAETLVALDAVKPDLLFLDVQMPEMDGFAVIRARGADRMPPLVFVTAHDQFAVQAFEAHALDYLVKPLNVERFEVCLKRLRQRFTLIRAAELAAKLKDLLAAERARHQKRGIDRLIVPTSMGQFVISSAEIDWIGAEDYYACLHVGPKTYLLRESLTSLAARLDSSRFVRLHREAIVQLDRITEVRASIGADMVVLRDGTHVPISRRKRAILREFLRRGS